METTFCELKGKEVINVTDGKRLGRIIDLVFETNCCKVLGFIVPSYNKSWNIFKNSDDIFIPCKNICKIGEDVILVDIFVPNRQAQGRGRQKAQYLQTTAESVTPENNTQNQQPVTSTYPAQYGNAFNNTTAAKDINQY